MSSISPSSPLGLPTRSHTHTFALSVIKYFHMYLLYYFKRTTMVVRYQAAFIWFIVQLELSCLESVILEAEDWITAERMVLSRFFWFWRF